MYSPSNNNHHQNNSTSNPFDRKRSEAQIYNKFYHQLTIADRFQGN